MFVLQEIDGEFISAIFKHCCAVLVRQFSDLTKPILILCTIISTKDRFRKCFLTVSLCILSLLHGLLVINLGCVLHLPVWNVLQLQPVTNHCPVIS